MVTQLKTKYIVMRKGIAMIELIFALVIIGITLSSAPLLMNQAIQSGYVAIQQESVSAAAAQMDLVLTRTWDEVDANQSKTAILTTTYRVAENFALTNFTAGVKRIGMDGNASRITAHFTSNVLIAASTLGADGGDLDDVDDFNGNDYNLSVYLSGSVNSEDIATKDGDYIDRNISIRTTVAYGDDVPRGVGGAASANDYSATTITFSNPFFNTNVGAGKTTNIKLVTVRLTTRAAETELSKNITFSAFTCNIGSYSAQGQNYP
jgi:Tfp pilus assembly protein PilV